MGKIGMDLERLDAVPYFNWDAPVTNAEVRRALAANKITALLGRTAPRDLVDLFALFDRGHALEAALADARTKDAAVDPGILAWVLSQWRLGPDVPLPLGVTLDDVERMRAQLIERLLALVVPHE